MEILICSRQHEWMEVELGIYIYLGGVARVLYLFEEREDYIVFSKYLYVLNTVSILRFHRKWKEAWETYFIRLGHGLQISTN